MFSESRTVKRGVLSLLGSRRIGTIYIYIYTYRNDKLRISEINELTERV